MSGLLGTIGNFLGGPIAGAIGGLISGVGQHSANQQAQANFNRNMAWQKEMATTAIQKRVADLQAAGLSPMLAYQGMGAAQATGGSSIPTQNSPGSAAANARMQSMAASSAEADIELKRATAAREVASAKQAESTAQYQDWLRTGKGTAEVSEINARIGEINASKELKENQKQEIISNIQRIEAEIKNLESARQLMGAQAGKATAETFYTQAQTRVVNLDATQREFMMPIMIAMYNAELKKLEAAGAVSDLNKNAMTVWWRKLASDMGFTQYETEKIVGTAAGAATLRMPK